MLFDHYDHEDLNRTVSEMLAASSSSADLLVDGSVEQLLHRLRERLGLDVVFVAEFIDGKRMFRFVDRTSAVPDIMPGVAHPLEASLCQRVVDGRLPEFISDLGQLGPDVDLPPLPFRIGTHLGAPVVLGDGKLFGTLCCFSTSPNPQVQLSDIETLRQCARLVALKLDDAVAKGLREPTADWDKAPLARYRSEVWRPRGAWALLEDAQSDWLDS